MLFLYLVLRLCFEKILIKKNLVCFQFTKMLFSYLLWPGERGFRENNNNGLIKNKKFGNAFSHIKKPANVQSYGRQNFPILQLRKC